MRVFGCFLLVMHPLSSRVSDGYEKQWSGRLPPLVTQLISHGFPLKTYRNNRVHKSADSAPSRPRRSELNSGRTTANAALRIKAFDFFKTGTRSFHRSARTRITDRSQLIDVLDRVDIEPLRHHDEINAQSR